MTKREDFEARMSKRIALLTRRMKRLEAQPGHNVDVGKLIEDFKAAGELAGAKLTELKASTEEKWNGVKIEMKKIWRRMETALRQAIGEPVPGTGTSPTTKAEGAPQGAPLVVVHADALPSSPPDASKAN